MSESAMPKHDAQGPGHIGSFMGHETGGDMIFEQISTLDDAMELFFGGDQEIIDGFNDLMGDDIQSIWQESNENYLLFAEKLNGRLAETQEAPLGSGVTGKDIVRKSYNDDPSRHPF